MAQQRNGIVFFEDSERHLKLVGKLYDQVKLLNIVYPYLILDTDGRPLICHNDDNGGFISVIIGREALVFFAGGLVMLLLARGQWLDGLSIQFLYSAAFVRFIYLNIGFQSLICFASCR